MTFLIKHDVHLFCTHSHSKNPYSQQTVCIDLPLGFSIYSLPVSREGSESAFQKLYSATIDLQLSKGPAFHCQIYNSWMCQTVGMCAYINMRYMWFCVQMLLKVWMHNDQHNKLNSPGVLDTLERMF